MIASWIGLVGSAGSSGVTSGVASTVSAEREYQADAGVHVDFADARQQHHRRAQPREDQGRREEIGRQDLIQHRGALSR